MMQIEDITRSRNAKFTVNGEKIGRSKFIELLLCDLVDEEYGGFRDAEDAVTMLNEGQEVTAGLEHGPMSIYRIEISE